jgi:hypothetical protein
MHVFITAFPRNFGIWLDKIIPRWFFHIGQNAILDSDMYLLHIEVTMIPQLKLMNSRFLFLIKQ